MQCLVVSTPVFQNGLLRNKTNTRLHRKRIFAGSLSDEEARSKYREVISAQLLMKLPDPMLRNFHFDQLSDAEQAKYLEEAKK